MIQEAPVNILLVDDRPENLVAMESVLEGLGQNLVKATSGREALRRLLDMDFAVILMDVQMPGMDGFETAKLIRSRPRSQLTPILFVTAINKTETHVSLGYSVGAVDYVFKPFDPDVLRAKVQVFVELQRNKQALEVEVRRRREAEAEVRKLNTELEQRVQDRTRALRSTNEELEREIAIRKRAEQELELAARRKDEFLAMLAHELRNPLAAIANADYVLEEIETSDRRISRLRNVISRQTRHLARLVDDLLDISRITQGKVQLRIEQLDLNAVLGRAIESVAPLIEARRHTLEVSLPSEPVRLNGDPTRLEQVFSNLLNNAAKYTEPGGNIRLAAEMTEPASGPSAGIDRGGRGEVIVRVRDNGVGIAPELLPGVFDLFTQAERTLDRAQGGLGIGLALVRNLVEMHGGRVSVRSEGVGRGSEFSVTLPLPRLRKEDAPASIDTGRKSAPAKGVSRELEPAGTAARKVLVVDDNLDAADTLAEMVSLWGHEAIVVYHGMAALEAFERERPEVVLLDIGLPDMDGFEVAARLREKGSGFRVQGSGSRTREVPSLAVSSANSKLETLNSKPILVALTGYGQEATRRRVLEHGFDRHLTKPVEPAALKEILDNPHGTAGELSGGGAPLVEGSAQQAA